MPRPANANLFTANVIAMIARESEPTAQTEVRMSNPGAAVALARPLGETSPNTPGRLRVLHFFSYLGLGGTELTALRVVTNLGKDCFENRLCGLRGFEPQVLTLRYPDADLVSLPVGKEGFRIQILSIMRLIKAYRPHIVHSRNWGTIESILAARLAHVPIVVHSEHGYEMDTLAGLPQRRRLFRRVVYGMADAVFTVTGDLQQYHARQAWISPSRIRVIHNGIDTQLFAPNPHARRLILEKAGVPIDRFVVGSVGRLVPIKDHGTLLKSAELLVHRGIDVHVLLAGSGPELTRHRQYLEDSAALAGRVTFLGSSANVSEILNAMDVFVLPSISEGMSNTLLEAMACGLPVLATRVGGNPEVVGDERSGRGFVPGDINGLAQHLESLAGNVNLRRSLGTAARQRAVSMFSLERMVEDYRSLYMELAVRRGILARNSG
jgi:sugar transferase (PEP-CTERM/EpsH1 system associated)